MIYRELQPGCGNRWIVEKSGSQKVDRRRDRNSRGRHLDKARGAKGRIVGQVGDGNRKDIRNAVEAAHAALEAKQGWAMRHGYNRSQILYFIAENLDARNAEFVKRIVDTSAPLSAGMTGRTQKSAQAEVDAAVERLFTYAAWADKYGGNIQETTLRGITVAV
ncbi:MAG: aldehyde dehydrogenase family protein, partial [Chloroflexi bacterium]|nr:aldehyde dehydrogenase family protein [Chloroflexota bacterium]